MRISDWSSDVCSSDLPLSHVDFPTFFADLSINFFIHKFPLSIWNESPYPNSSSLRVPLGDLTLDKNSLTLDLGGGEPLAASKPQTSNYSDRPYEKRLTQSGRRFISVDVDANLLEILDKNRGKLRRGVFLDRLLSKEFAGGKGDNLMSG